MKGEGGERILLRVEGMSCDSCAEHVTRALKGVPGVVEVDVPGWRSARAEVMAEPDVLDEALVRAVEAAGYRATVIERHPTPTLRRSPGGRGYDLMVIGGGSAGFAAAIKAAELGANVAMVERGPIGGTCVNVGCVPSKTLIHAIGIYHLAGVHRFKGVHTVPGFLGWAQVIEQKDELVAEMRRTKYLDVLAAYPQITYIQGEARLEKGNGVHIGDEIFEPGKIVLATGADPWAPPIPGLSEAGHLTSTTAMELRYLPRSLIVLGANAVGLELAQIFARAGSAVTVIELLDRILPFEDREVGEALAQCMREEGLTIVTGAETRRVERDGRGYRLVVRLADGSQVTFEAEELLVATGRRPNTANLSLEAVGVEVDGHGAVKVNEYAQTTNPDIYAAGDCANLPMFVYVAAHSGTVAAENALNGNVRKLDLEALPKITFTDPQVASAGLTEGEAAEQGYEVKTTTLPLEHVPKALVARDTRGLIKLVADAATDRLLGVHIVAHEAGEIIQIGVMALRAGLKAKELAGLIFPYLTLAEGLKLAAQTFEKDITKLSCCAG